MTRVIPVLFVGFFIFAVPTGAIMINHWNELIKEPMAVACITVYCLSLITVILIGVWLLIPRLQFKKAD